MAASETAHVRIGEALKREATIYARKMGLDLSSFVRYALSRVIEEEKRRHRDGGTHR